MSILKEKISPITFKKRTLEVIKEDVKEAQKLYRDRHLGNNRTMQREKKVIDDFIQLGNLILKETKAWGEGEDGSG